MSPDPRHNRIDYLELGAKNAGDYAKTKAFFEAAQAKVTDAGGIVTRAIFPFPGGRRFHFADPSGNELGVWSDR